MLLTQTTGLDMTKPFLVTKTLAQKVLKTVDAGLVSGLGVPKPGEMCVEAAVCYAMRLPHSDKPTCVSSAVRSLKISLNDLNWSSNAARANGLRRLAIAQLGSNEIDEKEFIKAVILGPCKTTLVKLFKKLGIKNDLEKANDLESFKAAADAAYAAARAAYSAADAAARAAYSAADAAARAAHAAYAADAADAADAVAYAAYAADAAARAAYSADAVAYAAYAADAAYAAARAVYVAAYAADAAARAAYSAARAVYAAARAVYVAASAPYDKILANFAEGVVQVLIKMDSPGCKFLSLAEG